MERQEELAVGKRLFGHIDGRTTDLADALFRNRTINYSCRERAALERAAAVPRPADLHGSVDAACQAGRLRRRGRGRHAGADDARRRRRGARLRQHLPPSRRAGRAGLRQRARLHLPLSRLDLRQRRQAPRHHRQGGLRRPRSREPRPGAAACGREARALVRAAKAGGSGRKRADRHRCPSRLDRGRSRGAQARDLSALFDRPRAPAHQLEVRHRHLPRGLSHPASAPENHRAVLRRQLRRVQERRPERSPERAQDLDRRSSHHAGGRARLPPARGVDLPALPQCAADLAARPHRDLARLSRTATIPAAAKSR